MASFQVLKCHPKMRCQRRSPFTLTREKRSQQHRLLKVRSSLAPCCDQRWLKFPTIFFLLCVLILETSEVTAPTSETPQPITTEMEVDKPDAEPGNDQSQPALLDLLRFKMKSIKLDFDFSNVGPYKICTFFPLNSVFCFYFFILIV